MAPKETPKIRKSKKVIVKVVEDSQRVIVVDVGVIGGVSIASQFSDGEIDDFLEKNGLPLFTKAKAPTPNERPDDCPKGWVVLYEYPFKIGYTFPSNPLMTKLLTILQLSPAQLIPLLWRVLHVIDKLTTDMGMDFGLEDLLYMYELRKVENTRYTFVLKSGRKSLVENSGANDRGWKKRYVFVNESLIGENYQFLHHGWNAKGS